MRKTIDLYRFRKDGSRVFSGRDLGAFARKASYLPALEFFFKEIIIEIPTDTISVNPSFFIAMFGPSVKRLGEAKFKKKYNFVCYKSIEQDIEEGIKDCLMRNKI